REAAGQVGGAQAGYFRPAVGGNQAVLRVQTDDDMAREAATAVADKVRLIDRLGADDDVGHTGRQVVIYGFNAANTAADLDRQVGIFPRDGGNHLAIDRPALEGAVQVHQVE